MEDYRLRGEEGEAEDGVQHKGRCREVGIARCYDTATVRNIQRAHEYTNSPVSPGCNLYTDLRGLVGRREQGKYRNQ